MPPGRRPRVVFARGLGRTLDLTVKTGQILRMLVPLLLAVVAAGGHPVIGDVAPDMVLTALDGKSIGPAPNQANAVMFFATWCSPCHEAIADLLALRHQPAAFTIILVAVGERASVVREFVRAQSLAKEAVVALDPAGVAARAWGQDRFPTTYLVDGHGRIRHINRGYGRGFRARMQRWLADLQMPNP